MRTRQSRGWGSVAVAASLLLAAGLAAPESSGASSGRGAAGSVTDVVRLLPLHTSGTRIVDSEDRDVILRGANVNSLGEYWQGVPTVDPTIPVTDADWSAMAARGFSVVRLLVTWSRIEPARDAMSDAYLDDVEAAVDAAAAHGMYTVIDMHQDAYSAFISTADPATCPAGTTPAKGWDGAPAWATLTDGLSTCLTNGERNSSPAVNRAWNNFYDDVDGIRGEFVEAWRFVADRFNGRPEVAGYDLLNEPETSRPAAELKPIYEDFLADVIAGIRAEEASAPFGHLLFVEPALPAGDSSRGLIIPDAAAAGVSTTNVVAAAHNYSESISIPGIPLTIEGTNDLIQQIAEDLDIGVWGGEYGFWDTSEETLVKARRYAADEDAHAWGGAWWQWRQSCGDPHAVQWSGSTVVVPAHTSTHLNRLECPGNVDLGPNDAFLDILGRGYARTAPGRISTLRSDVATGFLKVAGSVGQAGGELVVWSPTADDADHPVTGRNLTDITSHAVDGGRLITAHVTEAGDYVLWIGPVDEEPTTTTTTTVPVDPAGGATPVSPSSAFTG